MSKLSVFKKKTDRQQLFMVLTLIDYRNDKMFNSLQLSFQHFDVISMVDRSTDNGKLLPIAN